MTRLQNLLNQYSYGRNSVRVSGYDLFSYDTFSQTLISFTGLLNNQINNIYNQHKSITVFFSSLTLNNNQSNHHPFHQDNIAVSTVLYCNQALLNNNKE
ncbi:MAG: hypothetical protein ABI772_07305 [Bacteroidota bacterium]